MRNQNEDIYTKICNNCFFFAFNIHHNLRDCELESREIFSRSSFRSRSYEEAIEQDRTHSKQAGWVPIQFKHASKDFLQSLNFAFRINLNGKRSNVHG